MNDKNIIFGIAGVTVLIIGGGAWLSSGSGKTSEVAVADDVTVLSEGLFTG